MESVRVGEVALHDVECGLVLRCVAADTRVVGAGMRLQLPVPEDDAGDPSGVAERVANALIHFFLRTHTHTQPRAKRSASALRKQNK